LLLATSTYKFASMHYISALQERKCRCYKKCFIRAVQASPIRWK